MPEEHDQLFERALARHLRADDPGESLCLDPETLAAYHERVLSAEEMTAAKTHIASCSRCQEILAELESTDEVSDLREEPAVEPVEIVVGSVKVQKEVFDEARAVPAALPLSSAEASKKLIAISSRRRALLWVAPGAAIAASLLLWMGLERGRKSQMYAPANVQVAESRPAQGVPEESSQALNSVPAARASAPAIKQKEMSRTATPPAPEFKDAKRKKDDTTTDKELALPQSVLRQDHVPILNPNAHPQPGPSAANSQSQASNALQQSAPAVVAGQMTESVEVAPAAPQLDSTRTSGRAAKAGAGGAADAKQAAAAAPGAPPPPPPGPSANAQSEIVGKNQAVNGRDYSIVPLAGEIRSDIRIVAPGGAKVWVVGPSGQIAFSGDGGRSWTVQSSGVAVNLTGGSAPSDKVCWIAGASGTLLRTINGGKTWKTIATPFPGDVAGVQATDAQHASIRDAASGTSYETSDGGATWKQTANE